MDKPAMGKQRIHANLGEFETLTQEELRSELWQHSQRVEQARLAGMKVIRFPPITVTAVGTGAISISNFLGGSGNGPGEGFIWEVQRVTVASVGAADTTTTFAVYVGSDLTFNGSHLITSGVPVNTAFTPPKRACWVFGGEDIYVQTSGAVNGNQYTLTGIALGVPAEMQGKIF
jgi:hypothetical protein